MTRKWCANSSASIRLNTTDHFHSKSIEFTFMRDATKKHCRGINTKEEEKNDWHESDWVWCARGDCSQHFFQRTRSRSTGIVCVCLCFDSFIYWFLANHFDLVCLLWSVRSTWVFRIWFACCALRLWIEEKKLWKNLQTRFPQEVRYNRHGQHQADMISPCCSQPTAKPELLRNASLTRFIIIRFFLQKVFYSFSLEPN